MPIVRNNYQDTLRMRFDLGPDPEDPEKRILRARSYTRGRYNAGDENFWNLAKMFEKVYAADLVNTYRVMHVELKDE
jgi:hypothetical protein